ncbi:hypothetical protein BC628DRAFT_887170 [Trametes gibbosa]|nr:hypothetical protein BC628DRAFT_887170 [Trametes gibbosa]
MHEVEVDTPPSPSAPILAEAPVLSTPALRQELYGALSRADPTDNFDDSFFQNWHHKSLSSSADDGIFFRSTSPQTPGLSPSKQSFIKAAIPPESPYDPTRTPAFRHSPARLPSDQPWRATASMSDAVRQLTLGMLVRGEASPNVRGLDVSPIVIQPANERTRRSIFSPPSYQTPGSHMKSRMLDTHGELEPDMLFASPRRLFADEDRLNRTPSILSRMGDFAWPSPMKDFSPGLGSSSLAIDATPPTSVGEVEDPFKAYLHLSPAPKVAGDSSPAHPPSSSGSDSSASRQRHEALSTIPDFLGSPTPSFGPPRTSLSSMSKLRWRVFPEDEEDVDMDSVEEMGSLVRKVGMAKLGLGTPLRVQEQVHRRGDSSSSLEASSSDGSGVASSSSKPPLSSGSIASNHSRRDSSPFHFGSHGRQRSASGSSGSHKAAATAGLMDKILGRQEKPQRRRTSHMHDNDVAVDAMGSPFKVGRKTSRNEFLYSLDGDCEMQEVPLKKRRKTINGRD